MAVAMILRLLLLVAATKSRCEPPHASFHQQSHINVATQIGEILKPPPPPPPVTNIQPVPFHKGNIRSQRQNVDLGYHYQPPPQGQRLQSHNFRFPSPFYKQYNFNFVPTPQPFTTTTPAQSNLFQKVSHWLFPPTLSTFDNSIQSTQLAPLKKDCNPCNSVPWIPVIRYDLSGKSLNQNIQPAYGPPSYKYTPQSFQNSFTQTQGVPFDAYGPPKQTIPDSIRSPSSTYGPPSPTHSIDFLSPGPPSSTFGISSSSFRAPSTLYGSPLSSYSYPSSTYGPPSSTYVTPSSLYSLPSPTSSTFSPSSSYDDVIPNYQPPQTNGFEPFSPSSFINAQLPKISEPSGFKNSYGEPITNLYTFNVPYSVSATAADSSKLNAAVLPQETSKGPQNTSFALSKPSPFSKGRNIHTLQPVALPNLSVSPLPPIFNARPFRNKPDISPGHASNINIAQSVPLAEFTHSIEYPPTIIQSPIIDVTKNVNQSKSYRNIQGSFVIDHSRDISSQASEDHIESTKKELDVPDASFETTGPDGSNDGYNILTGFSSNKIPHNHKETFVDLRGVSDKEVDKYRTESNLQSIDSPLLYLKPSAPHKDFNHFLLAVSTTSNPNDYEIYEEGSTTPSPQVSTNFDTWKETRHGEFDKYSPSAQANENKPKVVQIIIPYTNDNRNGDNKNHNPHISPDWVTEEEFKGRKVPTNTESYYDVNTVSTDTYSYTTENTQTERPTTLSSDTYDNFNYNTPAILNDLYDVREPPFDIIKLQQNIDDWTEQEYAKHLTPYKKRNNGKFAHAKQIPDDYLTTISPISNFVTTTNYDYYDHDGAGSVQHNVINTDLNKTDIYEKYKNILRMRDKNSNNYQGSNDYKSYIYTAASSFRTTTTTPAPWSKLETSISPLTKEKVYVVTSKPWRESNSSYWNAVSSIGSLRSGSSASSALDNLPFKSPRFQNRPSFGTLQGGGEPMPADSSELTTSWHQRINDLESSASNAYNSTTALNEGSQTNDTTNTEEVIEDTTTAATLDSGTK